MNLKNKKNNTIYKLTKKKLNYSKFFSVNSSPFKQPRFYLYNNNENI
jgi:hypothetical protein